MIPSSLRTLSLKLGRAVNKVSVQKGSRVLIFHSICQKPETVIDVSPANFRDQLKYLLDEGYNIISLEELVQNRANPDPKSVVLTFDDGFVDFYENAIPILQELGNLPATVYAISQFVQDPNLKFKFGSGANKRSMDTRQIEEISKLDFINVGSHTHTHLDLVRNEGADIQKEIDESFTIIEQLTGNSKIDFCYPWANHNRMTRKLIMARYATATIGKGGVNKKNFDPYLIKRIPIKNETIYQFSNRLKLDTLIEDRIRDLYNRIA
jgi:peptidoglycan/xylan/chitin deacetylase (PgdA/CDA1 family)